MEKLKPCPFCGGLAKMKHVNHCYPWNGVPGAEGWMVSCSEPWCPAYNTQVYRVNEGDAVKVWNTRATEPLGGVECYECQNGAPMIPYRTCHIIEDGYMDDPAVCSNCGTHYDDGRYCKYCGAKVIEE